jgi:hypothetical protein
MSFTRSQTDGGGGFPSGFPFPRPPPPPPFYVSSPFPFPTGPPETANATRSANTVSSPSITIASITSSATTSTTAILPITQVPNPAQFAAEASETAILEATFAATRTNIIISVVLGGIAILLIIAAIIIFYIWMKRRGHNEDSESPPFTPLTPAPRQGPRFIPLTTSRSVTQLPEQRHSTHLSMGPRTSSSGPGARGFGQQAFSSHPPNRPARSLSAPVTHPTPTPAITTITGIPLPYIQIQPNTPSVFPRDSASTPSPISGVGGLTLQPGASRQPLHHEALQGEAAAARPSAERENAGRLGLPVIERAQRASVSTIMSDMGFEDPTEPQEMHQEREAPRNGERRGGERAMHSTRASSGVFPEPGD